jgi:FMN-dependent NADH-azoreductase
MSNVLVIHSSILGAYSQSSKLLDSFSIEWQQKHPTDTIVIRDLVGDSLPVLDSEVLGALSGENDSNKIQKEIASLSLKLIDEIKAANYVVIAVPMYNFGIPVQLKMWFDLICRAGITFSYTQTGSVGLLTGKKVLLVTTTGGVHRNTATDLALAHAQTVLGFIGLSDITVAYAESLAMGSDAQIAGLHEATQAIKSFVASH